MSLNVFPCAKLPKTLVTHERTKIVTNSKLQLLTFKFEEIHMREDETFDEFYVK